MTKTGPPVLALPISWKGTIQQYVGELHREHTGKKDVRIYDYVEQNYPQVVRMWNKRQHGYRAMGYVVRQNEKSSEQIISQKPR